VEWGTGGKSDEETFRIRYRSVSHWIDLDSIPTQMEGEPLNGSDDLNGCAEVAKFAWLSNLEERRQCLDCFNTQDSARKYSYVTG
jgi:hypothetical protein